MWENRATLIKIVDGDTLKLQIDLGYDVDVRATVRLYGINTPEIHGVKKTSEEYAAGMRAKEFVEEWIDGPLIVKSYKGSPKHGKYGRWLLEIFKPLPDDRDAIDPSRPSLNAVLLSTGNAKVYR